MRNETGLGTGREINTSFLLIQLVSDVGARRQDTVLTVTGKTRPHEEVKNWS